MVSKTNSQTCYATLLHRYSYVEGYLGHVYLCSILNVENAGQDVCHAVVLLYNLFQNNQGLLVPHHHYASKALQTLVLITSSTGTKLIAAIILMLVQKSISAMYIDKSPNSWTFLKMHCDKWKRQPFNGIPGYIWPNAFIIACSKSTMKHSGTMSLVSLRTSVAPRMYQSFCPKAMHRFRQNFSHFSRHERYKVGQNLEVWRKMSCP